MKFHLSLFFRGVRQVSAQTGAKYSEQHQAKFGTAARCMPFSHQVHTVVFGFGYPTKHLVVDRSAMVHGHKASIRGCTPKWQGAGCRVLGYTQASTATATLLRPAPRLLSCWSVCAAGLHPSMPACQQPGVLACWGACQQHRQTSILASLPCWLAINQHASMPACQQLGCWHARVHASSTDTPAFLAPSRSAGR